MNFTTTPILYLDFDGVLHPGDVFLEGDHVVLQHDTARLFEWAPRLVEVLAAYPDVSIVLSSSWVDQLSFDEAREQLPVELQRRVIGSTFRSGVRIAREGRIPDAAPSLDHCRYDQILNHVQRYQVQNWLAIDDDVADWPESHFGHLVATDPDLGLAQPGKTAELQFKLAALRH